MRCWKNLFGEEVEPEFDTEGRLVAIRKAGWDGDLFEGLDLVDEVEEK